MLSTLVVVFGLGLLAVWRYFYIASQYWRNRGIDGPVPKLFTGHWSEVNHSSVPLAIRLREWTKYGKVYGYQECTTNLLATSDADMLHEVFVEKFDCFYQRRILPVAPDADHEPRINIFQSHGARWKRMRSVFSPAFAVSSIKQVLPIVEDSWVVLTKLIEQDHGDGEVFDIKPYFKEFTMDTIARLVLGQKQALPFKTKRTAAAEKLFGVNLHTPFMFFATLFPPVMKRIRSIVVKLRLNIFAGVEAVMDDCEKAVKERMEQRERGEVSSSRDYIDLYLDGAAEFELNSPSKYSHASTRATKQLSVDEVVAQSAGLILVGYDTTSTALMYTTWMLARHPEVQRKCQEEMASFLSSGDPTFEDYNELKYFEGVIKEALRFFPLTARGLPRRCMKSTTIGTYEIEKGTVIVPDVYGIHFDSNIWGDDVEEFKPERWLDASRRVPPHAFIPFGGGPRICIGMRLGIVEMKALLAQIIRRFEILPDPLVHELDLYGCTTIQPKIVPVMLKRRNL